MRNKVRFSLLSSMLCLAGMLGVPGQSAAQEGQSPAVVCSEYSGLSGTYSQGQVNGGGPLPTGAVVTITATLGTATSATFEILNALGSPYQVVAGPASVPVTLTHTVTSAESAIGIGFEVASGEGTVNITTSCTMPVATAPALSPLGLLACGLLLLGLGGAVARYKMHSSP